MSPAAASYFRDGAPWIGCVPERGVSVARGKSCAGVHEGDHRGYLSNQLLPILERK